MKKNKKVTILLICVALFLMLIEFSNSVSLFISNYKVLINVYGYFEWKMIFDRFKDLETIPWWSFRYIIEFFVIIILSYTLFYVCEFREKFNQKSKNEKIQKKIEKLQSQLDD